MTRKVLVVASGGGHWIQMRRLAPVFRDLDVAYVSVNKDYAAEVPGHRFYSVHNVTRRDRFKLAMIVLQLIRILLIERPQVVITTGSAPGVIALTLAKTLLRAKTIWIDSIANCMKMSTSGMQARHAADVWLTQWPELQKKGGPDYWGAVL